VTASDSVSILTGLERPVQPYLAAWEQTLPDVSILTGLERPVQPSTPVFFRGGLPVSILTGLERPVQRVPLRRRPSPAASFNPHRP